MLSGKIIALPLLVPGQRYRLGLPGGIQHGFFHSFDSAHPHIARFEGDSNFIISARIGVDEIEPVPDETYVNRRFSTVFGIVESAKPIGESQSPLLLTFSSFVVRGLISINANDRKLRVSVAGYIAQQALERSFAVELSGIENPIAEIQETDEYVGLYGISWHQMRTFSE